MPVDTKEIIIKAFKELMDEKKDGRVTVTEIVKRCGITRKTFYYHFSDIYDLVDVMVDRELADLFDRCMEAKDLKEVLELFLGLVQEYYPQTIKAIEAGYYPIIGGTLSQKICGFFKTLAERKHWVNDPMRRDFEMILQVFTFAVMGAVLEWGHKPEEDITRISEYAYRLLTGKLEFLDNC